MAQEKETTGTELKITAEETRSIAGLLRYAVSLNTTVGLVSPTQRRLATSTYRAVELAAGVLEGKPLQEAIRDADQIWTGSLEEDHLRPIELLSQQRDALKEVLSTHLTPEQLADYLEVQGDQYLELLRQSPIKERDEPGCSPVNKDPSPVIGATCRCGRLLYLQYAHRHRTAGVPEVVWR